MLSPDDLDQLQFEQLRLIQRMDALISARNRFLSEYEKSSLDMMTEYKKRDHQFARMKLKYERESGQSYMKSIDEFYEKYEIIEVL